MIVQTVWNKISVSLFPSFSRVLENLSYSYFTFYSIYIPTHQSKPSSFFSKAFDLWVPGVTSVAAPVTFYTQTGWVFSLWREKTRKKEKFLNLLSSSSRKIFSLSGTCINTFLFPLSLSLFLLRAMHAQICTYLFLFFPKSPENHQNYNKEYVRTVHVLLYLVQKLMASLVSDTSSELSFPLVLTFSLSLIQYISFILGDHSDLFV